MTTMTGGQALVAALERQGLEVIFGLPGVQLDWLFDALYEARERIAVIHTRNEQPTSYMADGFARSTGKIAACLVVPGPGVMNALAGLSTAYANNSQVLCIAGQIQSNLIDKGHGLLHEVPYQLEMMRSATKWAGRAASVQEIPALVDEAFLQLRTGRPRPVEIEIPPDVLQASAEVTLRQPRHEAAVLNEDRIVEAELLPNGFDGGLRSRRAGNGTRRIGRDDALQAENDKAHHQQHGDQAEPAAHQIEHHSYAPRIAARSPSPARLASRQMRKIAAAGRIGSHQ